jgi:sugar lactone lactonase YvrE
MMRPIAREIIRRICPLGLGFTLALTACGGGGGNGGGGTGGSPTPPTNSIEGTVSGLTGMMVLQDNGADNLTVAANGNFAIPTMMADGAGYDVTIQQQPTGNRCTLTNGTGTLGADTTSVAVTCVSPVESLLVSAADYANVTRSPNYFGAQSVALAPDGSLYVVDSVSGNLLVVSAGGVVSVLALTDATAGLPINSPGLQQISVGVDGGLIVAAITANGGAVIQSVSLSGEVSTLAGSGFVGSADGTGSTASFSGWIKGLAVDRSGNIYAADFGSTAQTQNNKIRRITPAGVVSTLAGSGAEGDADGSGSSASFNLGGATGSVLATDSSGNVYVVEWPNDDVRVITPAGIVSTLAGSAGRFGLTDGPGATVASFANPNGIAIDGSDNIYIADGSGDVRMITQNGMVSTLVPASGATIYGSGNTVISQSGFEINCMAASAAGNLYIGGVLLTTSFEAAILEVSFP